MGTPAERIAKNDATFRDANEHIAKQAVSAGFEPVPFLCECADPRCTSIVRLSLDEYERIRANSRWFLNEPEHQEGAGGFARVVQRGDRYVVIEKIGEAGSVAESLDPRRSVS